SAASSPTPKPSGSPEKMDMSMPGMQMPQTSPSPSGNQPTTNEQPKSDMQNMPGMNMGNTTTQLPPAQTNSMPGMDMSGQGNKNQSTNQQNAMPDMAMPGMKMSGMGRISSSDPNALMIMAGAQM